MKRSSVQIKQDEPNEEDLALLTGNPPSPRSPRPLVKGGRARLFFLTLFAVAVIVLPILFSVRKSYLKRLRRFSPRSTSPVGQSTTKLRHTTPPVAPRRVSKEAPYKAPRNANRSPSTTKKVRKQVGVKPKKIPSRKKIVMAKPFKARRRLSNDVSQNLPIPPECNIWRNVATDPHRLHLYRKHYTSLDMTDWFLFVSMFTEAWHKAHANDKRRPVYVDVGANHARRWSNTYFFDRCMGWDGICVEANDMYHEELLTQRHCSLVDTCVSNRERLVKYSFNEAYSGVVRGNKYGWGVDGKYHATADKFKGKFKGIKPLRCTTLQVELNALKVKHVDFMSLDSSSYELPVLEGIDFSKVVIDVLVVESKRREVVAFLARKGYIRYPNALKQDIYIRKGVSYSIDSKFVAWLRAVDKSSGSISARYIRSFARTFRA